MAKGRFGDVVVILAFGLIAVLAMIGLVLGPNQIPIATILAVSCGMILGLCSGTTMSRIFSESTSTRPVCNGSRVREAPRAPETPKGKFCVSGGAQSGVNNMDCSDAGLALRLAQLERRLCGCEGAYNDRELIAEAHFLVSDLLGADREVTPVTLILRKYRPDLAWRLIANL